jgi:hypothetical protein
LASTVLSFLAQPHWALLTFATFWLVGAAIIARFAGWAPLATEFLATGAPTGERLRFITGSLGSRDWPMRYRNCLRLILGKDGLHISVSFPFNFRSPPLFVPWSRMELAEEKQSFSTRPCVFRFGQHWSHLALPGVPGQQVKSALSEASRASAA